MNRLFSDLRSALRSLASARGFTLVAVATIALGVGSTTAIFSLVRGVLLRELPFPEPQRLVAVWEKAPQGRSDRNVVNPGNYLRWRERAGSFSSLTTMIGWTTTFAPAAASGSDGAAERLTSALVGPDFFPTFGVQPLLGRGFAAEESTDGHDEVVVLSEGLWRRRFAADPGAVGSKITLDGTTVTVVGVVSGFEIPPGAELWAPIGFTAAHRDARGRSLSVVGRLRPGVTVAAAAAEMERLAADLERERPEMNAAWGATVLPLQENFVGSFRRALWVLLAAVGCLLLVACANLANLWLVRAMARDREMAVRSALGAGSGALALQTLIEALLIGLAGGALGLFVARFALTGLLAIAPTELPRFMSVEVDFVAGLFAAAATLATALLVAWLPTLRAARTDAASVLNGARGSTVASRTRGILVVAEIAVALVLVLMAALLGRSLGRLEGVDPGFVERDRWVTQLSLPSALYREPAQRSALFARLVERTATLPGVESSAVITWLPMGGGGSATSFRRADLPAPKPGEAPVTDIRIVSPGFFHTLGIPLLRGRGFDERDDASAPLKAVVSAALVRQLFPDRDPIGGTLAISWGDELRAEIVGVVGDVHLTARDQAPRATVYWAQAQQPSSFMSLVVAAKPGAGLEPRTLEPAIRSVVAELDRGLAPGALRSLEEAGGSALRRPRFLGYLIGVFALSALALAALGIYGVESYRVAGKRREIGVRVALGARRVDVVRGVLLEGLTLALLGGAVGLAVGLGTSKVLSGLLFEVGPYDGAGLAIAVGTLIAVALVACAVPAWRAARIEPATALRQE